MNKKTFVSCIGYLQTVYGETKKPLIEMIWNRFKSVDDEDFKNAVSKIIDTFMPTSQVQFPLPAHIIKAMGLDSESLAIHAVSITKQAASTVGPYRSVSFGDRALHATINHFGGWIEVSNWHDKEWSFNESKFKEVYSAKLKNSSGPDYLEGRSEISYTESGGKWKPSQIEWYEKNNKPVLVEWQGSKVLIGTKLENKQIESHLDIITNALAEKMSM